MLISGVNKARATAAVVVLTFIMLITGCSSEPTELSDRLAVGLISVDYSDNQYLVSIACLDPQAGSTEGKTIGLQYFEASGEFLDDAFKSLDEITSRRLFYGHSAGLVISQEAAAQKLPETLHYFVKDKRTRVGLYGCLREGLAGELLRLMTVHKALAVGAVETVCENADNGGYELAPLFKLAAILSDDGRRASVPLLASRPAEATGAQGDVFELHVAGEIGIEHKGGLMYNQTE